MTSRPTFFRPSVALLDHDPAVCSALKFSLELEGFQIMTFEEPETLRQALRKQAFDALIVGHAPPAIAAPELFDQWPAETPRPPTVLTATNPTASLRRFADKVGAILIEKPLLSDALVDALRARIPS
ncbi:hypothetical protein [Caulobacter sp.]|uniref:hypothetical protein n=1 Tax=Caulobacter sp. TaxID=78 RepID=UPI002B4832CD|nr:hypothetical protein [Caulobacter sp.]HJV40347.1 hypothetical protein [Caulobacter sp.]